MNNALNKTCAVPRATACGPLVRLARQGAAACVIACIALSAHAQQYGERGNRQEDSHGQRADRYQPAPRHGEQPRPQIDPQRDPRSYDSRAFEAREEQRRQMQMQQQEQQMRNAESARRGGRMTADERRDLRRQINEAGMDLYPNTPRR